MTQHKFWQRALTGGIGAQIDWLAACMIAGVGGSWGLTGKVNHPQKANRP